MSRSPKSVGDARGLAWGILRRVEEDGAYADALLGHQLGTSGLDARDQALTTRLVYGTLAWQGYLDHILAAFTHQPLADLDAPVRTLLRLAVFQIAVLTKIPPFAAVNTAVNLAKRFRGGAATGLLNAVLRRVARGWQQVPFASRAADPIAYLSTRLSHPRWLVERWLAAYGIDETEAFLRANNEAAPTVLRVNQRRIQANQLLAQLTQAGHPVIAGRYSPSAIRIEPSGAPEHLPGYAEGLFSLQGEASQLVGFLAGVRPGQRVLDACAAPGGKATHMAEIIDDRGEIVAVDVHARGVERIGRMAERLGLSIVRPVAADIMQWQPGAASFDCVLVDAPCSGLGTLREHPEVKWRRTPQDVANLADLQLRLLDRVAEWVLPGGALVYSTCTVSREENDDVVAGFLRVRPRFAVDDPRSLLPPHLGELIDAGGAFRTFPHRHGMDGFFAVRLKARQ